MELSERQKRRLKQDFGPWALVTGASSGIGLELARLLASAGLNLVIVGRNETRLAQARDKFIRMGVDVRPIRADVSEKAERERLLRETEDLDLGLVVLSAGFGTSGLFVDSSLTEEINMLRVNCESILAFSHYYSRKFKKNGRGGIVLLSSIVGFQGVPYAANYAATKAYVQSLGEALAVELKGHGVAVLSAAPGPVVSGFGQRAKMKMGKVLKPADVGVPILKALGRKKTSFPGRLTKLLIWSLALLPRKGRVLVMRKVMKGMAQG